MLFRRDETGVLAQCVYFNITNSTVNRFGKLISTSSSSATILPTSSIVTSTVAKSTSPTTEVSQSVSATILVSSTSIPSQTSAPQTTEISRNGLSPQVVIGMGVGAGLVVAAVGSSFVVWFFFVRRKREDGHDMAERIHDHDSVKATSAHDNWYPPAELYAAPKMQQEKMVRSELPG